MISHCFVGMGGGGQDAVSFFLINMENIPDRCVLFSHHASTLYSRQIPPPSQTEGWGDKETVEWDSDVFVIYCEKET
jgi:hypothetical protein